MYNININGVVGEKHTKKKNLESSQLMEGND
jgi:hypothetical protein